MRSIAILAGGRATRFDGRDKSALLVDGRTILDRQLAELSSLTNDVMIVASGDARLKGSRSLESTEAGVHAEGARVSTSTRARHERATVDAPKRLRREGGQASVRVIRDIVPGCGPLGGLHAALTAALGDAVFVVACDMPYVTAAFADYLFSLAGDAQIVVPRTERGYHPLCAVYARACLGPVATRL